MRRMLLLVGLAVLCSSTIWAQDNASSQSTGSTPSATAGTFRGCLSGSKGNYMLTQDDTGTMYTLMGSDSQLKGHVGHEVVITGQVSGGGSSAASGSEQASPSASSGGGTLEVSDVSMVSKHCSAPAAPSSH